VASSTEFGSQDPERTRAALDRFYNAMAAEVAAAGGTVEMFAGDAVVAVFGAPAAQEDHAERALHASLSMRTRMQELFEGKLILRIGINTGEVAVGPVREGSPFLTGDAVNVTARLQQAAALGEILVGERTAAAAGGAFEFGELISATAKGKPAGIACRRLLRAVSLTRPRGVRGLRPSFIGRDSELELLQATYHRAQQQREGHHVTILGDAGVGKSRLVREFSERLAADPSGPLLRSGRCLPYGQGVTYWPLGEILKEHFGILENDASDIALGRLGGRAILGLTLGLDVAGDLHPLAARERLQEAWVDLVQGLVAERPVVFLVEDLHLAQPPLLEVLERLGRDVRGPLVLLATARPELLDHRAGWGGRRNAATVWLEPLSEAESARLLAELLQADLPPRLRELIVDNAEGNPFFAEELIGVLIDQGVLERKNGSWTVQELPVAFAVPDSIQAVLAARMDLLRPEQKAALQAASIIGRVFWSGAVARLLEGIAPDLEALEERDFIRRRLSSSMAGEREFAFKHSLTREIAYSGLPKARRAHLHAAFAGWLEEVGEGRDKFAPFLGHHYAQAVRPEDVDLAWPGDDKAAERLRTKAITWLRRAAELAVTRYEIDAGLALLTQALALEASRDGRVALYQAIGHANALKYDGDAFLAAMQNGLQESVDRGTRAEILSEMALQTATRAGMWKRRPDPELVRRWIDRALELAAPDTRARAMALVARCFWDPAGAEEEASEVRGIADGLSDPELLSLAFQSHAEVLNAAGRFHEAREWVERCFGLLDVIKNPDQRAAIHWEASFFDLACGRIEDARRLAQLHDDITSPLTSHHRVHGVGLLLTVEEFAGGWDRIVQLTPRAEQAVAANLATPCVFNARSQFVCAIAFAYLGDLNQAQRLEGNAEALGMEGYWDLDLRRLHLALARKDVKNVAALLPKVLDVPRLRSRPHDLAIHLDALSFLGDRDRVEAKAKLAMQPDTYIEPFALRALGRVRHDQRLIEQAAARFEAMGLQWHAAKTRELLIGDLEPRPPAQ
jgi:class 3 adenylate cyclase